MNCASDQTVSRQSLTVESRVWTQSNICGIRRGQSRICSDSPPNSLVFPWQYALHLMFHMYSVIVLVDGQWGKRGCRIYV